MKKFVITQRVNKSSLLSMLSFYVSLENKSDYYCYLIRHLEVESTKAKLVFITSRKLIFNSSKYYRNCSFFFSSNNKIERISLKTVKLKDEKVIYFIEKLF